MYNTKDMLHLQNKKNDIFCLYAQEMSGYIAIPVILWRGVKTNVLGAKYYIYIKFVQN